MEVKRNLNHWDHRFLELAQFISAWSKDPSTKFGAVITDDKNRILSVGFNGFPRGIEDTEERYADRELKYKMIIHGERNAILFADRDRLEGAKLYGWPFMPCSVCAGFIIQSGIKEVIAPYNENERWQEEFKLAQSLFNEAKVKLFLV